MRKLRAVESPESPSAQFERFILPYFDSLYGRAFRFTGKAEDAEDLVQDLCVRAFAAFGDLKRMNNPSAWLLRVLYNLFVDQTRRLSSSPVRLLTRLEQDEGLIEAIASDERPDEAAETALLGQELRSALKALRPEDQALLILYEVEGYSLAEIEEITRLPPTTVKSRLQRSRVRLGRMLQHRETHSENRGADNELPRRHRSAG